jgi:hypothetical protein
VGHNWSGILQRVSSLAIRLSHRPSEWHDALSRRHSIIHRHLEIISKVDRSRPSAFSETILPAGIGSHSGHRVCRFSPSASTKNKSVAISNGLLKENKPFMIQHLLMTVLQHPEDPKGHTPRLT